MAAGMFEMVFIMIAFVFGATTNATTSNFDANIVGTWYNPEKPENQVIYYENQTYEMNINIPIGQLSSFGEWEVDTSQTPNHLNLYISQIYLDGEVPDSSLIAGPGSELYAVYKVEVKMVEINGIRQSIPVMLYDMNTEAYGERPENLEDATLMYRRMN